MNERHPFQKRAAEIAGVTCLATALFLLLALASYHPLDHSFTHYAPEEPIGNLTGTVGSHTADTLIRLGGIGILWLPAMLLITALRFFRDPEFRIGGFATAGVLGLILTTSALFSLLIGDIVIRGAPLHTGGLLGMAAARLLNAYLNLAGALIVLTLLTLIALMTLFDFSVVAAAGRMAAGDRKSVV